MARNGSGVYNLPATSFSPAVGGTTISTTANNTLNTDIATALTQSVSKDGQTVITGAIDFDGNEIILDVDGDTSITADTDDQIDFRLGGLDVHTMKTVASAVNGLDFIGSATGNAVDISAVGTDTNIDINLTPKGNGRVIIPKPSFSVHLSTSQLNINGATKVQWATELFDTNSNFDSTTNYRFTPTVAGKYLLSATVEFIVTVAGDGLVLSLSKNGATSRTFNSISSGAYCSMTVTEVVDANGSTDYFEVFVQNVSRSTSDIDGAASKSYWTGCKID